MPNPKYLEASRTSSETCRCSMRESRFPMGICAFVPNDTLRTPSNVSPTQRIITSEKGVVLDLESVAVRFYLLRIDGIQYRSDRV